MSTRPSLGSLARRSCWLGVLGVATPSHAESPWVLHAGLGIAVHETDYRGYGPAIPSESSVAPVAIADAGVRVHPFVAIGMHFGAQRVRAAKQISVTNYDTEDYLELETGVSVHANLHRFSVLPWLGVQSFESKRQIAGGVTIGYDILIFDRDRIGAFASASYGASWSSYYAACLGVGYRFW